MSQDSHDTARFASMLAELEGIKDTCKDCGGALIKVEHNIGFGRHAAIPYWLCNHCKKCTVRRENE